MRGRALVVAAIGLLLAGCGSTHRATPQEQRFAREMADTALAVGASVSSLDACSNGVCLRRTGPVASAAIAAEVARVAHDLQGARGKCLTGAGRSFLASLRTYESAAELAAQGRAATSRAAEGRAGTLAARSVDDFSKCAHTRKDPTPMSHALLLVQQQVAVIDKCNGLGCLDTEGARLSALAREQQRLVDPSFAHKGRCGPAARDRVDRAFVAIRRMGADVRRLDEAAAKRESILAEALFNQAARTLQNCSS